MKIHKLVLSMGLAMAMPLVAAAQTTTDLNNQVAAMNGATANQGQTQVIGKISSDFNSFLGENATPVVTGLRHGTPITLNATTPTGAPATTTTTVITPQTGPMGFGEVYISLALAKQQLSTLGITQPTPEQLQAALTGGAVEYTNAAGVTATSDLQGVLAMRSEGMGWGQIAQAQGVKLGPVMSAMKSGNKALGASAASSAKANVNTSGAGKGGSTEQGIVSSGGKALGHSGAASSGAQKGGGSSIVSASGKANGNAYGAGGGIVSGAGRAAGQGGGIVSAGGGNSGAGRSKAPSR